MLLMMTLLVVVTMVMLVVLFHLEPLIQRHINALARRAAKGAAAELVAPLEQPGCRLSQLTETVPEVVATGAAADATGGTTASGTIIGSWCCCCCYCTLLLLLLMGNVGAVGGKEAAGG
uniref:Uncharacterized protein n=1 Tax=Anopheles darlingi TaxID=43151 RepID=A0A2M4CKE6_ANODA